MGTMQIWHEAKLVESMWKAQPGEGTLVNTKGGTHLCGYGEAIIHAGWRLSSEPAYRKGHGVS